MGNLVIGGGMGAGKTELVKALKLQFPSLNHIYMSRLAVRIPLTLLDPANTSYRNLLALPKDAYIQAIIDNMDMETPDFSRDDYDAFLATLKDTYGPAIPGELAYAACRRAVANVAESVASVEGVRFLQQRRFTVVGLTCSFNSQVERSLTRERGIDPSTRPDLEAQVKKTNRALEVEEILEQADFKYNTDLYSPEFIARELVPLLK